jgi:hypothetical protein
LKSVESWRTERARAGFIRTFVEEYPSGPSAWSRLEHLAHERGLTGALGEHIQTLRGASALAQFEANIEAGGELPTIQDTSGLAGKDFVHLVVQALYDKRGDNDERGHLVLTNKRILFGGTRTTSIPWQKVESVRREGLNLLLQRNDRQTPSIFCFGSLAELLPAEHVSRRLIGEPPSGFVPAAALFRIPEVPQRPLLPAGPLPPKAGNDTRSAAVGLTLASLMLFGGVPQVLNPPASPAAAPNVTTSPLKPAPVAYSLVASPANAAIVVVDTATAVSDGALVRIAHDLHRSNLPPTDVMFWTDAAAAPHALPLTKEQLTQRVAVVRVGGSIGARLGRNKAWLPTLEK